MLELTTQIEISASAGQVWAVLTDFERYPEWNPFVLSLRGRFAVGERLEAQLDAGGGKRMTIKPHLVFVEEGRSFGWLGRLLIPGLFDGQHAFALHPQADGGVLFKHSERFSGVLLPFLRRMLETKTKNSFEAMNRALKQRVESL